MIPIELVFEAEESNRRWEIDAGDERKLFEAVW